MFWRRLAAVLSLMSVLFCASPALADWTHPMSFSNADLTNRDFSG
ncbi:hypothetical protein [Scytonema sp. HK-05]